MLTVILIALVIYAVVKLGLNVKLPHPGLQASVDVLKAANLNDRQVRDMARQYVANADSNNTLAGNDDPYHKRLIAVTERYIAVNNVPLNFRVYKTSDINAFATADGSIRIFSGLMDLMTDDELMAIVGHEMGHIRNSDALGAMRKAYITSAIRNTVSAVGGTMGSLSASQLGSLGEKYAASQFSQKQEYAADDFSFGFLVRNGYNVYAMATALEKLVSAVKKGGGDAEAIAALFSTHPDAAGRAMRMRRKAEAYISALPCSEGRSIPLGS